MPPRPLYSGQLRTRRGSMVPEHQFHQKDVTKGAARVPPSGNSGRKSLGKEKKEGNGEKEKLKDRGKSSDKTSEEKKHRSSIIGGGEGKESRRSVGKSVGIKSPTKQRSDSASRVVDSEERGDRKRRKIDSVDKKPRKESRERSSRHDRDQAVKAR